MQRDQVPQSYRSAFGQVTRALAGAFSNIRGTATDLPAGARLLGLGGGQTGGKQRK